MINIQTAINRLLPHGRGIRKTGNNGALIAALAENIDDAKTFIDDVKTESIGGTAVDTIDRWVDALGLYLPPDLSTAQKQAEVAAAIASIGGASYPYVIGIIQQVYPDIDIDVIYPSSQFRYDVVGFVPYSRDIQRLMGMIERLVQAHLEPTYYVGGVLDGDVAICNRGMTGFAECGRAISGHEPA